MNRSIAAALLATVALPGVACAQASPSNFTSATRYDAMRRVVGTIAPDPDGTGSLHYAAVRNTYDQDGRLIRVEKGELANWQDETVAPANWSNFTVLRETDTIYDAMDRKITDAQISGGTTVTLTQYSYDPVGRLQCTQVRMDQGGFGNVPADACAPVNGGGVNPDRVTKNVYDNVGQLVQVWRAWGTALQQAYETYSYTANGKQSDIIDANGNHARMTYDGLDRVAQWQFPSAAMAAGFDTTGTPQHAIDTAGAINTNDYEAYGYDANDNRTSLRKRDGRTFGYTFDALNRMTVKTVPTACVVGYSCMEAPGWATRSVYYAYDAWGRQTEARFDSAGGGDGVFSGYDGFGRLTSTTTAMNGTSRQMTFGYDADGNRAQVTYPDGQQFTYNYDGLDRKNLIQQPGGAGVAAFFYDTSQTIRRIKRGSGVDPTDDNAGSGATTLFGYDGVGRLTQLTHDLAGSAGDVTYGPVEYNFASQIKALTVTNDGYAWRGATNASKAYVPNGLNQYASVAGAVYSYDSNGNSTSDGTTSYTYDAENRLISASNGTTLTYDANGRLWQTAGGPSGTTQFLDDGDQLSVEYDGSGNMLRRYIHGTGEDDPLVWYEGNGLGSPRYYHADHQGSIVGLSDTNGNSSAINSYDEYGVAASGNQGRFGYTGQAWLPDLGFWYYKARVYSPKLGRMLQTDPVGYKDQVNLYAYVANDPVNRYDSTGRDGQWVYNKTTGQTTLRIPVYYHGAGATPEAVANIERRVESLNIPNANYKIDVVVLSSPGGKGTNSLDLSPGEDRKAYPTAGEGINKLGGNVGHINSSNSDYTSASAHDTLHFVGIKDRYVEGAANADGSRGPSSPAPGYTNSNIMTSRQGTQLNNSQFEEARRNSSTQRCTVKGDATTC